MDCQDIQNHLSAYHDGELPDALRLSVEDHIERCSSCQAELKVFDRMSGISRSLVEPEPPQGIWASIEMALDGDPADATVSPATFRRSAAKRWPLGLLAAAAVVLLAVGVVWVTSDGPGHHHDLAADFEQYLDHFAEAPEMAQNLLLAKYEGEPVDMAQAETLVGYRPAVAAGLPQGYSLEGTYVLKMPCCTCVQTICRRADGRVFAIFEHSEDQAVWCGDKLGNRVECNGQPCMLTKAHNSLLATWKSGPRQLTIVGARDLDEVGDLMSYFEAVGSET